MEMATLTKSLYPLIRMPMLSKAHNIKLVKRPGSTDAKGAQCLIDGKI